MTFDPVKGDLWTGRRQQALDDFVTEGDEILFGTNFGIVTDIQTGPDGALYLVGPGGTILRIFRP
jgi:hypothetical protein